MYQGYRRVILFCTMRTVVYSHFFLTMLLRTQKETRILVKKRHYFSNTISFPLPVSTVALKIVFEEGAPQGGSLEFKVWTPIVSHCTFVRYVCWMALNLKWCRLSRVVASFPVTRTRIIQVRKKEVL